MFGLLSVLFVVIFVVALANIVLGMWGTARFGGKIFQLVEKQLDQQIAAYQKPDAGQPQKVDCPHCGSSVSSVDKCPNCGASLA